MDTLFKSRHCACAVYWAKRPFVYVGFMIFYRLIFPFTSVVNITVFNGIINNSLTDITAAELPYEADIYMLSGGNDIRSRVMYLGGTPLKISENGELPEFTAKHQNAGNIELAPGTCTFIVI